MIVNRRGNKAKLAAKIIKHFPPHDLFIDMFFGAGGLFFNKPRAKYNYLNDNDREIFNFWIVFTQQKEDLKKAFLNTPISLDIFNYWKNNRPKEPVAAAVRFLYLSNLSINGDGSSLRINTTSSNHSIFERKIKNINLNLKDCFFLNYDFRELLKKISFVTGERDAKKKAFIYADPPYCETRGNYQKFTEADTFDLFEVLENSEIRFALSEFDHPFVLSEAKRRRLNIITIGERQNLKNRRKEILITNYDTPQKTLF